MKNLTRALLNYYATFTETRFQFRTLTNYQWSQNELAFPFGLYPDFEQTILRQITGNLDPITVKPKEYTVTIKADEVRMIIKTAFDQSDKQKFAYDFVQKIELLLAERQQQIKTDLTKELGLTHFPATANFVSKFIADIDRLVKNQPEPETAINQVLDLANDLVIYDLYSGLVSFNRYAQMGTAYVFVHELSKVVPNKSQEDITYQFPLYFAELELKVETDVVKIVFPNRFVSLNTPALNFAQIGKVFTEPRAVDVGEIGTHLHSIESYLKSFYGTESNFIAQNRFAPLTQANKPELKSRLGLQVIQKENRRILDYSELITAGGGAAATAFAGLIDQYIKGEVNNIRDQVDTTYQADFPKNSAAPYLTTNPLPLNQSQRQILTALKHPDNKIMVIDGPPGTGKSHTIAALVYEANRAQKSVVITSHKKEALDVVEKNLIKKLKELHQQVAPTMVRISANPADDTHYAQILTTQLLAHVSDKVGSFNHPTVEQDTQNLATMLEKEINTLLQTGQHYPELVKAYSVVDALSPDELASLTKLTQEVSQFDLQALIGSLDTLKSLPSKLFTVNLNHLPSAEFWAAVQLAAKYLNPQKAVSSLSLADTKNLWIKIMGDKAELEQALNGLQSLKYQSDLVAVAEFVKLPTNQLTLNDVLDSQRELDTFIKHQLQIKTYTKVVELLRLEINDFAAIYRELNDDGKLLAKLEAVKIINESATRHQQINQKLTEYRNLNFKQLEHLEQERFKKLQNSLGQLEQIKLAFTTNKRITLAQAKLLLSACSAIIIEPESIAKYFPMEKDLIDILIIDEASQVSIAESLSLILRAKQVIVFGDELQYGAVAAQNVNSQYKAGYFKPVLDGYSSDYSQVISSEEVSKLVNDITKEVNSDEQEVETLILPKNDVTHSWIKTFDIRTSTLSFCKVLANYTNSLKEHFRSYPEIIEYSKQRFYSEAKINLIVNRIRTKPIDEVLVFAKVDNTGFAGEHINLAEIDFIAKDIVSRFANGFVGSVGIITSFKEQAGRCEEILRQVLPNYRQLEKQHELKVWFVGDVQGEERDLIYYSLVEDDKFPNGSLTNIYPTIGGSADSIRSLKMQRLNVGFSRAKDTMIFVHSQPLEKYSNTRLGEALKIYQQIYNEAKAHDVVIDVSKFGSKAEEKLYSLLIQTPFYLDHKSSLKVTPQFEIGKYIEAEYHRYLPRYRVDFLLVLTQDSKEKTLIIEYDGIEFHAADPSTFQFNQEYLEYDQNRQLELESFGYHFLRINKYNLRPKSSTETEVDVLNRLLIEALGSS